MKKFTKVMLTISSIAMLAGCPSPTGGTNTPASGTPGVGLPGTGAVGGFATKQDFIKFVNCLKSKADIPADAKPLFDTWLTAINVIPDAQWALAGASYVKLAEAYAAAGCK